MALTVDLATRTYTGNPTVSSIRSTASSGDRNSIQYAGSPTTKSQSVDLQKLREQARANVQKERPDLFRTQEQISAEAQARAKERGLTGARFSAFVTNQVSTAVRNNQIGQSEAIQREVDFLVPQEEKRIEAANKAAAAEEVRIANEKSAAATASANREGAITKADRSGLNNLEVLYGAKFAGDPEAGKSFNQVKDYLLQLKEAAPEERNSILSSLRAEANDLVDRPFNKRIETLQTNLATKVKNLNDQLGVLTESQQFALEKTIRTLDADSASSLSDNLDSLIRRGGLNSGLLMSFANDIIMRRDQSASDAQKETDLALKSSGLVKQAAISAAEQTAAEDIDKQKGLQTVERENMFSDLTNDATQQDLYLQEKTQDVADSQGLSGAATDAGVPTPTASLASVRLPTVTAAAGTSLDLARQAASGTITLAQQQAMRNDLMMKTPAQQTTPTTLTQARSPVSGVTSPVVTAKTAAGQALQTNTAARLAARLSK